MKLENQITDLILEVANTAEELTTSDLQGFAQAQAKKIIELMKEQQA